MIRKQKPEEVVDECIVRLTRDVPPEKLGLVLAQLVGALWSRSSRTLSEITIDAIFERALFLCKDKFPLLATYKIDHSKPHNVLFEGSEKTLNAEELTNAFRYLLVTILNLIGNLTSDILLDGLYRELKTFFIETPDAVYPIPEIPELLDKNSVTPLIPRVKTHISNLDDILGGGLPMGTITIIAGSPGTGKTTLSQQMCFPNATNDQRVIFFQTLSEPTAKTLKYLSQFKFYEANKIEEGIVEFIDLGGALKLSSVNEAVDLLMNHVKRVRPNFVVIDNFKVFEDLSKSREELRKFSYEVVINLMAWECTALLLGEFSTSELETNPLFSIVDGLIKLTVRQESGEQQRFLQVVKMRGTNHSRDEHAVSITEDGVGVYAPRVTIRRSHEKDAMNIESGPIRARLGISKMDELLGDGVPIGSSFLISGVSGTGKTLLSLEFIYRGAKEFGQKGIYFSFEETEERLRAEAIGMGWEIDELIKSGMIEIIFIAQPEIIVEKHLLMMSDQIRKLKAKRIVVDSVSLFIHKVSDQQVIREKIFQLATLVQKAQGIGFFISDIPYGSIKLSQTGVEETVVDGVILLTSTEKDHGRERFIEIYKLRNTAHLNGRHKMEITGNGIFITPREKLPLKKRHEENTGIGAIYDKESGTTIPREEKSSTRDPLRH